MSYLLTPAQHSIVTRLTHSNSNVFVASGAIMAGLLSLLSLIFVNIHASLLVMNSRMIAVPRGKLGMLSDFLNAHMKLQL